MNLYVGTSGFSYAAWKGTFYPADLSDKQMLRFYGERFRSVEINYTFHHMPTAPALEAWAGEVPAGFRFALKAPQRITHGQRLLEVDETLAHFLEVAGVLREHLGPLFFQLPPDFPKDLPRLRGLLLLIPAKHYRVAFEFRHPSWFDEEVYALLRRYNAALCIAESEERPEVHAVATADWGYLRLRRQDYGVAQLKRWSKLVRGQDWREAFVYFKHEDEARGPLFAGRFLELAG
jgi:uncharacterized protein YecE (DUF72 family)